MCIQSYCIQQLSVNYDEGLFAYYGATILKMQGNKDVLKFDSKLPVTALNMLPRAAEQLVHPGLSRNDSYPDIIRGRYISLLAAVLLALIIYRWSALLYGETAGLFSYAIYLVCPNFLAHGIFVSSDIFACLFMTGSLFYLWRFCETGRTRYFFLASCLVGLALISKFSMVHLAIFFPVLLLVYVFVAGKYGFRRVTGKNLLFLFFIFAGVNWFIINAAHLFYGMFIPLSDYTFQSTLFRQLQSSLANAGHYLPIPFSSSYIRSMDAVMYFDHLGGGKPGSLNGPSYILGKSQGNGFWYYYFVALFYKLPVPVLLLLVTSAFLYLKKVTAAGFFRQDMFLLVPAIYFLIYLDFFYSTQLGIRHILVILPLLYVFAGSVFQQANKPARYFVYALAAYQLISVGIWFPHFLPYTNEFITNKKMAYTKIADTNLCYGEGKKYLSAYLGRHPEAKYMPAEITSGKIVMEVNEMLNLDIGTMGKYDWVRAFEPSDHIHSQYLIFDVKEKQADSLKAVHLK